MNGAIEIDGRQIVSLPLRIRVVVPEAGPPKLIHFRILFLSVRGASQQGNQQERKNQAGFASHLGILLEWKEFRDRLPCLADCETGQPVRCK
jgi:hypothetical protein